MMTRPRGKTPRKGSRSGSAFVSFFDGFVDDFCVLELNNMGLQTSRTYVLSTF